MKSLYDRFASTARGARALAAARLRHEILGALHQALKLSRLSQSEVAGSVGVRRSAVNQVLRGDGNVRINTLADYLHAMGFELDVRLVRTGEPREAALEQREVRPISQDWRVRRPQPTTSGVFITNESDEKPMLVRWIASTHVGITESVRFEAELTPLPSADQFTPLGGRNLVTR
ncbi:helix-turn-helix domain-containing protein [Streptosporangium subroseum]|uniref:helix-turn-helix domain-containing protein n=1 Tax=Streptosporangium subroseum TaxID=106412 RepID=UPI00118168B6|nr:helix-turn-helix transcriptional regulator [Streptosporangium subroseum]